MNIILLIIILFLTIFDIYVFNKNKKLFNRKIKNHNKIRFTTLTKQYLNNVNNEDIKDLICFLYKYIEENKKNENKK